MTLMNYAIKKIFFHKVWTCDTPIQNFSKLYQQCGFWEKISKFLKQNTSFVKNMILSKDHSYQVWLHLAQ